jgi:hypothetical protein
MEGEPPSWRRGKGMQYGRDPNTVHVFIDLLGISWLERVDI